jgi:hypothetical protein
MTAVLALALGFLWGYLAHWAQTRKVKGVRLIRHQVVVPGIASMQSVIAEEWRTQLQAWTLWAEQTGMSELAMVNAGVCSNRAYRRIVEVLKGNGILVRWERSRTHYAPGWCGAKVRSFLRRGKLALDLPPSPPPVVHVPELTRRAHADLADARRRTQMIDVTGEL